MQKQIKECIFIIPLNISFFIFGALEGTKAVNEDFPHLQDSNSRA